MKNKKYSLLVFALLLAMVTSACSGGGKTTENPSAEGSNTLPSVVSDTSKATPPDDGPDAPVTPRITYSSGTPSGTSRAMTADKYELAYTAEAAYDSDALGSVKSADGSGSTGTIKNDTPSVAPPAFEAPDDAPDEIFDFPEGSTDGSEPGEAYDPSSPVTGDSEPPYDVIIDDPDYPEYPDDPTPAIRLLTAGEWNDNDNWGFFTNLVNSQLISFPSYGIDPRFRTKVEVKLPDKTAAVNVKVELLDKDDSVLWSSVTDKNGIAYVFDDKDGSGVAVRVSDGAKTDIIDMSVDSVVPVTETNPQSQQQGNLSTDATIGVTFDGESKLYEKLDLMFIVDATGSMSDEMVFLQKEFTGISEAVGNGNTRYSVNFYRDEGDEYVTKCYDFTKNVQELQKQLNSEIATGGGDTPEAVDKILEESILKSNWSDDSVKLAFMIFDAPPHEGTEEAILRYVKAASEKGIRLIPVVSSNSERETELFGRACAIATGGTYVFLTDDSGIGSSHLEPVIGEYKVEKLYDLIIRVINEYKQAPAVVLE